MGSAANKGRSRETGKEGSIIHERGLDRKQRDNLRDAFKNVLAEFVR